jgi:hypothetical protein
VKIRRQRIATKNSQKCIITSVLFSAPQIALAQGITNPAGGGAIPVFFHILIGVVPLAYVFLSLAFGKKKTKVPIFSIKNFLILVFLIVGFTLISVSDHFKIVLYLYLEMLLIVFGLMILLCRGIVTRALAIVGLVAFVVLLNFYRPKLVDFQTRIYVDNEKDIEFIEVSYPGHWREMHLADGRVLLNINPHKRVGGAMHMISDANKINSPVSLGGELDGEGQVIFDVYEPTVTSGTWGWLDRPEVFFKLPLLGVVHIIKFENRPAAKALLLDDNKTVKCQYLFEARGEQTPERAENGYVRWSVESTVEEGSEVKCE